MFKVIKYAKTRRSLCISAGYLLIRNEKFSRRYDPNPIYIPEGVIRQIVWGLSLIGFLHCSVAIPWHLGAVVDLIFVFKHLPYVFPLQLVEN